MPEKFKYSLGAKTYRRKTFTTLQKVLLYAIVFADIAGSSLIALSSRHLVNQSPFFLVLIILPTFLAFALIIFIAFNPKGAEANFVVPGPDQEIDAHDWSAVKGSIRMASGKLHEVEVLVPNVHGKSALAELGSSVSHATSDGLATEEMFDLAIETVNLKYPGSSWEGSPLVL